VVAACFYFRFYFAFGFTLPYFALFLCCDLVQFNWFSLIGSIVSIFFITVQTY
jgi:hypothetical protein